MGDISPKEVARVPPLAVDMSSRNLKCTIFDLAAHRLFAVAYWYTVIVKLISAALHRGQEMLGGQLCVPGEQHPKQQELSAITVSMPASLRGTRWMLLLDMEEGVGDGDVLPQDEQRRQKAGRQLHLWHQGLQYV